MSERREAVVGQQAVGVVQADGFAAVDLLDVAGIVRRVRRVLDLSQRDLAKVLGVAASTVGRWESGAREPGLSMLQRVLRLAGLSLEVVTPQGMVIEPFGGGESVRDAAGRELPAHLDVAVSESPARVGAPRRPMRDAMRYQEPSGPTYNQPEWEQPEDPWGVQRPSHPWVWGWLEAMADNRRHLVRSLSERLLRRRHARWGPPKEDPSRCLDACFALPGCAYGCTCGCEPVVQRPPVPAAG